METFNVVYGRNKNLKKLLIPSLFPTPRREKYICLLVVTRETSVKTTWSLAGHAM